MDIADAQSHVSYLLYVVAVDIGLHRKILPEVHPLRSDLQGQPLLGTTSIYGASSKFGLLTHLLKVTPPLFLCSIVD